MLRSPHAHANILSLDTSKAEAHPGVLAVVTSADFAEAPDEARVIVAGPPTNLKHLSNNVLAGGKALYKGHAIAAVAAQIHAAEEALALIDVEYEVLPSVTVEEAIADGAPQLHENYKGNIASHSEMTLGDIEKGFAEADIVVEKVFRTKTVHQGYIEPHTATAWWQADGRITVWCSKDISRFEIARRVLGIPPHQSDGDRRRLRRQDYLSSLSQPRHARAGCGQGYDEPRRCARSSGPHPAATCGSRLAQRTTAS